VDSNFTYLSLIGATVHLEKQQDESESKTAQLVFQQIVCRLCPQARGKIGAPLRYRRGYIRPSESSSVLAAIMKSFRCRPPIL
jgi:hypothetical protein